MIKSAVVTTEEAALVERARATLADREEEAREVDAEIAKVSTELARLDALPEVRPADVVAIENARRALRRLEADRGSAAATIESARAVLGESERARDVALVARVRAEVGKRREVLDEKVRAIAAHYSVEEGAFSLLREDPDLEGLRREISELQALLLPLHSIVTLSPAEVEIDSGPWGAFLVLPGFAFFRLICDEASKLQAGCLAEERAREDAQAAEERALLEPAFVVDGNGHATWVYSQEQADRISVPEHDIELTRVDPHRAIVSFDGKYRALIATKDRRAAMALRAAAERNGLSVTPQRATTFTALPSPAEGE